MQELEQCMEQLPKERNIIQGSSEHVIYTKSAIQ
jgi:hypothetical protein